MTSWWARTSEILGMQTPRARLLVFSIASVVIFVVPFSWLGHLSLWQALHVPSPSIGLTRAYWLLIHGHPIKAWNFNGLIYAVIAVGAPLLLTDALRVYNARFVRQK